ncbi:PTS glucose transporter subunit IIA [Salinimonas sp. HHU 13199]|uniref:PTS glucose transporter subunit IIA n=1 Tax=Salinimonas profundi TaxID=2729140 RepID=A0ABR8LKU8_9ALTE|nr:PTS glucose transporter subunit IIA [Salinimonas profundi]MBD3584922.1 PTS glucose transporter subunit IIA [Salinimonas profundi]
MSVSPRRIDIPSPVSGTLCNGSAPVSMYQTLFDATVFLNVTGSQLFAPFDGYLSQVDLLNYSVRYTCLNGLQFWFRIGNATRKLHTQGCQVMQPAGKKVSKGTLLMQFNPALLKQVDSLTAMIMLVNAAKLKQVDIKKARQYLALEDSLMSLEI